MRKNICLVARKRRIGANSIEEIFEQLIPELSKDFDLKYECVSSATLISDIIRLRRINADIYHITGDVNYFGLFLNPKKTIITVHDIGYYETSLTGLKKYVYGLIWFKLPLERVRFITTVSEFTQKAITKAFAISENKIKIIANPAPELFKQKSGFFNTLKPTILQIGYKQNKNLDNLIKAIDGLNCKLVVISYRTDEVKQLLGKRNIDIEIISNHLSYTEVFTYYKKADILFFASTYEGFGMPILEAQATGIPVITSNLDPMKTVAGKAAHFVNPYDISDIKNAIMKICEDTDYRNRLIAEGFANLKRFELKRIVLSYKELYSDVINKQ